MKPLPARIFFHSRRASPSALLHLIHGLLVAAAAAGLAASGSGLAAAAPPEAGRRWTLRDGDRVVLLGDTFVEREGDQGHIETALVAASPQATLSFRNLGWSGDTVWAESRGVFDTPAEGYAQMLGLVRELKPTVLIVAYGRNESFRGPSALPAFQAQLAKLCDNVRTAAAGDDGGPVRLVLVTPHQFEKTPLSPTAPARNEALALYAAAIRSVAAEQQAGLVDLFADLPTDPATPLTENGSHLSAAGYAAAARLFVAAFGGQQKPLAPESAEPLRQQVVAKNRLFFHRWRPANATYLFLFRKYEQGNNAVEIPQFDPLVEEAERTIQATARQTTLPAPSAPSTPAAGST